MADIRHVTKEILTEFIEIYRSHPALWKVKSKDYVNRNLKRIGYDALVQFYRKVDPNADRDLVSKKIQSIRGSFRKELKKFEQFKKSCASSDEQYVPSLWYFDMLMFTRDQETPRENFNSLRNYPSSSGETTTSETADKLNLTTLTENSVTSVEEEQPPDEFIEERTDKRNEKIFKCARKTKRKAALHELQQKLFKKICTTASKTCNEETDSTAFGKFIATKHAKFSDTQKIYAESLITKIIHRATLNTITSNTDILDPTP